MAGVDVGFQALHLLLFQVVHLENHVAVVHLAAQQARLVDVALEPQRQVVRFRSLHERTKFVVG